VSDPFLPFALPDIGDEEISEVVDSLRSGWITTGPKARRFEESFAAYLGGNVECIAVNSATAGLHLALEALGLGPGDEVIVPTHTFTATAEVVRYLGADPVFVDIDPDTYCIDPALVSRAITAKTRLLLPVHFAGLACDMSALCSIAKERGLEIVEDAAHAFPTRCGGELIGQLDTAAAVFSFYANKTIATGEGGMLVTRRPDVAKRARIMRLHGIDRDAFNRFTSKTPAWFYEVVAPGFKYNMPDIAAALGLQQLRKIDRFQVRREELAHRYDCGLSGLPLRAAPRPANPASTHAWHLYVVQVLPSARLDRDSLIQGLYDLGIGCSVHYVPLHRQPYWRDRYSLRPEQFPVSEELYRRCVSLPLYTRMSNSDVDRVVTALHQLLG
jgi:dTDP-4-amino-4,6-dideoxygalactose transaminase